MPKPYVLVALLVEAFVVDGKETEAEAASGTN
jgi:hypothetical protein